jgi:UDP-N-acetylglucosamine 4-epimerase
MKLDSKINLLITGGAGFIGSNLVAHFINDNRINLVRVVDDLSTGYYENIREFESNPKFEFIKGDISDYDTCLETTKGIHKVSHQAALGSVPRSIENPMRSTAVNILGTVNLLHAAVVNKVERVILACSSSTYGDHKGLPKIEDKIGKPLSPYAITKLCVEQMAEVFQKTYGLNYIGLRYFNIFGPKQNPSSPYAAVIPIFCKAFLEGTRPIINGDGLTSRDFTYVDNAVLANDLALFTQNQSALNQIYNTACNNQISLLEIIDLLKEITLNPLEPIFVSERKGDVKFSKADLTKINSLLQYQPIVHFREGLEKVLRWYVENETI